MTAEVHKDNVNNSIAKAVTILNAFTYEKPRQRLKDIAALTGINQRLMGTVLLMQSKEPGIMALR